MTSSTNHHLDELLRRFPDLAEMAPAITAAAEALCNCHRTGGKILACGNGGSAADSEHIVGELMKGFVLKRELPQQDVQRLAQAGFSDGAELAAKLQRGIPAISLTGHAALSTAIINDNDPHTIFAQQVYVLGRPGDILLALSTSGNSRNVVNAVKVARAFGLLTIGFTGARPSTMETLCDIIIKAPTAETFKVQEYHLPIYHTICLMVEEELFRVR